MLLLNIAVSQGPDGYPEYRLLSYNEQTVRCQNQKRQAVKLLRLGFEDFSMFTCLSPSPKIASG